VKDFEFDFKDKKNFKNPDSYRKFAGQVYNYCNNMTPGTYVDIDSRCYDDIHFRDQNLFEKMKQSKKKLAEIKE